MAGEKNNAADRRVEPDSYRVFLERQWADVHHSRLQEWSALGVVTGVHVGILELLRLLQSVSLDISFPHLVLVGAGLGLVFVLVGFLVTLRHRHLMWVKMGWISQAEKALGLQQTADNPWGIVRPESEIAERRSWRGLRWPRFLSTSWLILCFYTLLGLLDVGAILVFEAR